MNESSAIEIEISNSANKQILTQQKVSRAYKKIQNFEAIPTN